LTLTLNRYYFQILNEKNGTNSSELLLLEDRALDNFVKARGFAKSSINGYTGVTEG
jgi:hypothetical protein